MVWIHFLTDISSVTWNQRAYHGLHFLAEDTEAHGDEADSPKALVKWFLAFKIDGEDRSFLDGVPTYTGSVECVGGDEGCACPS